eukprot:TRINITY_DN1765_c0_g1_i1.p1 TRINITY_DN1765_c0_g1~~TRINITY_DN1765_c0_g1_i1.p1  ORF type:complete len:795 (-),score=143.06 TRINITY_DN1765_c0_g1_i1:95-2479(-)
MSSRARRRRRGDNDDDADEQDITLKDLLIRGDFPRILRETARSEFSDTRQATPMAQQVMLRLHGDTHYLDSMCALGMNLNETHPVTGITTLHLAAENHRREMVKQLLRLGADPYARDASGRLPSDHAPGSDIERVLLEAMQPQLMVYAVYSAQTPELPVDILVTIFQQLPFVNVIRCGRVCRLWHAAQDDDFWLYYERCTGNKPACRVSELMEEHRQTGKPPCSILFHNSEPVNCHQYPPEVSHKQRVTRTLQWRCAFDNARVVAFRSGSVRRKTNYEVTAERDSLHVEYYQWVSGGSYSDPSATAIDGGVFDVSMRSGEIEKEHLVKTICGVTIELRPPQGENPGLFLSALGQDTIAMTQKFPKRLSYSVRGWLLESGSAERNDYRVRYVLGLYDNGDVQVQLDVYDLLPVIQALELKQKLIAMIKLCSTVYIQQRTHALRHCVGLTLRGLRDYILIDGTALLDLRTGKLSDVEHYHCTNEPYAAHEVNYTLSLGSNGCFQLCELSIAGQSRRVINSAVLPTAPRLHSVSHCQDYIVVAFFVDSEAVKMPQSLVVVVLNRQFGHVEYMHRFPDDASARLCQILTCPSGFAITNNQKTTVFSLNSCANFQTEVTAAVFSPIAPPRSVIGYSVSDLVHNADLLSPVSHVPDDHAMLRSPQINIRHVAGNDTLRFSIAFHVADAAADGIDVRSLSDFDARWGIARGLYHSHTAFELVHRLHYDVCHQALSQNQVEAKRYEMSDAGCCVFLERRDPRTGQWKLMDCPPHYVEQVFRPLMTPHVFLFPLPGPIAHKFM